MLSEEQAIENLKDFKSISILYGNTFTMFLEQLKKYQEATETVLNLITKLQKENEEKDDTINIYKEKLNKIDEVLNIKKGIVQPETVEIIKVLQSTLQDFINSNKLKNRQIDLMTFSLADYVMYYEYDKCRNPEMIKNKAEELKQYFERKAENEK